MTMGNKDGVYFEMNTRVYLRKITSRALSPFKGRRFRMPTSPSVSTIAKVFISLGLWYNMNTFN